MFVDNDGKLASNTWTKKRVDGKSQSKQQSHISRFDIPHHNLQAE